MRSATFEKGGDFTFYVKTLSEENAPEVVSGEAVKTRGDILDITLSKPADRDGRGRQQGPVPDRAPHAHHRRRKGGAAPWSTPRCSTAPTTARRSSTRRRSSVGRSPARRRTPRSRTQRDAGGDAALAGDHLVFRSRQEGRGPLLHAGLRALRERHLTRASPSTTGDFSLGGEMTSLELLPTKAR